jgi:hypothetical protein
MLFNFIYALLGMQLFGGKISSLLGVDGRMNFDSFFDSFVAVFDIMTLENWNDLLITCLRTDAITVIVLVYFFSWIFIGNMVLLNLFLAVLLEGFEDKSISEDLVILEEDF